RARSSSSADSAASSLAASGDANVASQTWTSDFPKFRGLVGSCQMKEDSDSPRAGRSAHGTQHFLGGGQGCIHVCLGVGRADVVAFERQRAHEDAPFYHCQPESLIF